MSKTRLTPEEVLKIRTLVAGGVPAALVAAKYHLTPHYVLEVAQGKAWATVPQPEVPEQMDPEDAAVLIADESGHPYEWREILTHPPTRRQYLRTALRNTDPHSNLFHRLEQAGQALANAKGSR